jgi:hypothetical protein
VHGAEPRQQSDEADDRPFRIGVFGIKIEHILHAGNVLTVNLGMHQMSLRQGLRWFPAFLCEAQFHNACLVRRRDIELLRQLSLKSGMPIVPGGGFYTQPFYPREISTMSEDQVFKALVEQVEADPIGAFGEVGSWDYMTKDERKVFRTIGRAHADVVLNILARQRDPAPPATILTPAALPPISPSANIH